jgi:hypothetical protein
MLYAKFGSFDEAVSEEKFFRNQLIRKNICMCRPCLITDRDNMSNLSRGPTIDASYLVSVYLSMLFESRIFL